MNDMNSNEILLKISKINPGNLKKKNIYMLGMMLNINLIFF